MIHHKKGMDLVASAAFVETISIGEGHQRSRVVSRSFYFCSTTFRSFADSLGLTNPLSFIEHLNRASPPQDVSIMHPSRHVYVPNRNIDGMSLCWTLKKLFYFLRISLPLVLSFS